MTVWIGSRSHATRPALDCLASIAPAKTKSSRMRLKNLVCSAIIPEGPPLKLVMASQTALIGRSTWKQASNRCSRVARRPYVIRASEACSAPSSPTSRARLSSPTRLSSSSRVRPSHLTVLIPTLSSCSAANLSPRLRNLTREMRSFRLRFERRWQISYGSVTSEVWSGARIARISRSRCWAINRQSSM